jgi:hypothetical protein
LLFLDDAEEVHIPVGRNIGQGVGPAQRTMRKTW